VAFHGGTDPRELDVSAISEYRDHLALNREVSPSMEGQALSALMFVYDQVLGKAIGVLANLVAAKKPRRLPSVLTRQEVRTLLAEIRHETLGLISGLLYGTGMRLLEAVRLRVKDVDFGHSQIFVRDGKGQKDRIVPLPQRYRSALQSQIEHAQKLHARDMALGHGEVFLPEAPRLPGKRASTSLVLCHARHTRLR
jgi:integrase